MRNGPVELHWYAFGGWSPRFQWLSSIRESRKRGLYAPMTFHPRRKEGLGILMIDTLLTL